MKDRESALSSLLLKLSWWCHTLRGVTLHTNYRQYATTLKFLQLIFVSCEFANKLICSHHAVPGSPLSIKTASSPRCAQSHTSINLQPMNEKSSRVT